MQLTSRELEPFLSGYLLEGWREDELKLVTVEVERDSIRGTLDVIRNFQPGDGAFHLSVPQAFLWIAQLGIIHGCWDHQLAEKPGEIYLREINLQCRSKINKTRSIAVAITVPVRRRVSGGCYYHGAISIENDAFVGLAKYILPLPASAG